MTVKCDVPKNILERIVGDSYQDSLRAVGELRDFLTTSVGERQHVADVVMLNGEKIIDGTMAFMADAEIGTKLYTVAPELAELQEQVVIAERNAHNSEVAYTAAIEKQADLQATIEQLRIDLSNQTAITEQANFHKAERGQRIDELTAEVERLTAALNPVEPEVQE